MRVFCSLLLISLAMATAFGQKGFSLVDLPSKKKVEVRFDGKLLTAYCYFDSTEKPVLWPIKTFSGVTVTRGYPVAPQPGERSDHPHHLGLWMNYENVNGLDFWNNSTAIPEDKKSNYGSIRHQKILTTKAKKENAILQTTSNWVDREGKILLEEKTTFIFSKKGNDFIIDRIATIEAKVPEVVFKDVKDGMLGLRLARQLEQPSTQADKFIDASGNITAVAKMDNEGVTGLYQNKEALSGDAVWGKRSAWACIQGKIDTETITVQIIDHPNNEGYPTYWHARGYGLFAANPLGQIFFSGGKEELNFTMKKGERKTFQYRVVIHSGSSLTTDELNQRAKDFVNRPQLK